MAFPITRSAFAGTQGTNSTNWTLTYPGAGDILDGGGSAIVNGDLILVNVAMDGNPTNPTISGYTRIFNQPSGTACRGASFAKIADGTESGNFTLAVGASEQGVWRVAVYKNWYGALSGVEASAAATGTSANPDPPSFTPSWGSADTFWRAIFAGDDGRPSVSAWPTNYTIYQNDDKSNGSGGACMGSGGRELTAATDNPGTFTKTGTGSTAAWVAWVVAIRPAGPQTVAANVITNTPVVSNPKPVQKSVPNLISNNPVLSNPKSVHVVKPIYHEHNTSPRRPGIYQGIHPIPILRLGTIATYDHGADEFDRTLASTWGNGWTHVAGDAISVNGNQGLLTGTSGQTTVENTSDSLLGDEYELEFRNSDNGNLQFLLFRMVDASEVNAIHVEWMQLPPLQLRSFKIQEPSQSAVTVDLPALPDTTVVQRGKVRFAENNVLMKWWVPGTESEPDWQVVHKLAAIPAAQTRIRLQAEQGLTVTESVHVEYMRVRRFDAVSRPSAALTGFTVVPQLLTQAPALSNFDVRQAVLVPLLTQALSIYNPVISTGGSSVVFHDTFTEASNTNLVSHTPDIGTAWTVPINDTPGVPRVVGGVGYADLSSGGTNVGYTAASDTISNADYDVELTITQRYAGTGSRSARVIGRYNTATPEAYYCILWNDQAGPTDKMELYRYSSATATKIGGSTTQVENGDVVKLELRGSAIKVYVNNVQQISVTDSTITAAGKAGYGQGSALGSGGHAHVDWRFNEFKVTVPGSGGVSVVAQLLSQAISVYNHTISPGSVSVVANLLSNDPTLSNPAILQAVVSQLVANDPTLFDHTISPGSVSVVTNLLSNDPTLSNPSTVQEIVSQLLTNDPTIFSHAIAQSVIANFLSNGSSVYNPSIAQNVVTQLLTNAIASYDHAVSPGEVAVVAQLLTNGVAVNDPTITAVSTVVSQLLVQAVLVENPTIVQQVVTNLLANGSTAYDHTITTVSTIVAQLLSNPSVVNEHTIINAGFVVAELLANGTSTFNPEVDQAVAVPLLTTAGSTGDMPVYQNSGAGVAGGNNVGIPYPTSISAGDVLVICAQYTGTAPTYSGWNRILDTFSGQHETRQFAIYSKNATGSESGNFDSGTHGGWVYARMHRFTNATANDLFESVGWSEGTVTQITHQPVISTGINRLAVVFAAHQGDSTADFGELTGETGGDWTEREFYSNGLALNGSIALYTAPLAAAGTISGGKTAGNWYWGSHSAAMKPIIQVGSQLFNPKVVAAVNNLLLNSGNNLYNPTVVAVSQILAQLLSNGSSVNNPEITIGAFVNTDGLTNTPVVYDPVAIIEQFVDAQLIANGSNLYNPEINSTSTVVAVLLSNGQTLYQPTVQATNEVLTQLIDNGHSLYAPSVAAVSLILTQLLDNPPVTYDPTVVASNAIVSLLIQNPEALFDPQVIPGGVSVGGLLLVNAISVLEPAVTTGGVFVAVNQLSNPTIAENPVVAATSTVSMEQITQGTTVYDSAVTSGVTVLVPLLEITPIVYDPTIIPGGVAVSAQSIAQLIAAYNPTVTDPVAPGQTVDVSSLTSGVTAESPGVLAGMVTVQANLLDQSPSLYAPGITPEQFITAQIVAQAIEAHSPSISSIYTVLSESLSNPVSIFTPTSIPGGIVVQVGELILVTQVGNPRVFLGVVPTNFQWDAQSEFSSSSDAGPTTGTSDISSTDDDSMPTGQDDLRRTH